MACTGRFVATLALLLASCGLLSVTDAATVQRLMQEQLMAFYGTVGYSVDQISGYGGVYTFANGDALAYNSDGQYGYSLAFDSQPCSYGSRIAGDDIGPFKTEDLFTQMKALAPTTANLLSALCAANGTCSSQLAAQLPAGQTARVAIGAWTAAQATAWHGGVLSTFGYNASALYCPDSLGSGLMRLLGVAPQADSSYFSMSDWIARSGCGANSYSRACTRLFGLRSFILPPWLALAERLVRDLVMHNAPEALYDASGYNMILNPSVAASAYGTGSGRRLASAALVSSSPTLGQAATGSSTASRQLLAAATGTAAAADTYSPLDAQYAQEMAQLQLLLQHKPTPKTSATQRTASFTDCSQPITVASNQLQAASAQCTTAAASVSMMTARLEAAAPAGAGCTGPARLGLSLLSDALAVCPAGLCASRNATLAARSLAATCDGMAPAASGPADLSWPELLTVTCGLEALASQAFKDAATCCGSNCTTNPGCDYARIGALISGFPNLQLNGAAGSGIC